MSYELKTQYGKAKSFYGKVMVEEVNNNEAKLFSYNKVAEIKDGSFIVYSTPSDTAMRNIREFAQQAGFKVGTKKQMLEWYGKNNNERKL